MRPLPCVISKKANTDLEEIWLHTADKWSVEQAYRYHNLIFDEIDFICTTTKAGKSAEHIRKGYCYSKVKSHLIFYKIVNGTVQIVRILHEKMDLKNSSG